MGTFKASIKKTLKLNIKEIILKENQVLVMCAAGGRSIIAATLLQNEGYVAHNISDGFSGNGQDPGWGKSGLPSYNT